MSDRPIIEGFDAPAVEPVEQDAPPEPRRGDGGNCHRCGKALKWPAADGLGPVCRRIAAAERAAGGEQE